MAVEEKVGKLKLELDASDDPLKELDKIEGEVNAVLFDGQIEVGGTMINFNGLKDHLVAAVSGLIDEPMGEAKVKLVALMNFTSGNELKSFQRCVGRIRTQVADLQDTMAIAVESVLKTADVMDSDMYDAADEMLGAIGQARKAVSSVEKKTVYSSVKGSISSSVGFVNPFKKKKKEVAEETVGMEVAMRDETNEADVSAAKEKFKQCEEKLEAHTRIVLDSLNQVKVQCTSPSLSTPLSTPLPLRSPPPPTPPPLKPRTSLPSSIHTLIPDHSYSPSTLGDLTDSARPPNR